MITINCITHVQLYYALRYDSRLNRRSLDSLTHASRHLHLPQLEQLSRDPSRPPQTSSRRQREREEDEGPGLVCSGEGDGDEVDEGRDSERDLDERHGEGALDELEGHRGQRRGDHGATGEEEEGDDGGEGRHGLIFELV